MKTIDLNSKSEKRVIPFEVVKESEAKSMTREYSYHPGQELPVPAEAFMLLTQLVHQAIEQGTTESIQTTPVFDKQGNMVDQRTTTVYNRTPFAHMALQALSQIGKLGIAYDQAGLLIPVSEVRAVQEAARKGIAPEILPVPGATDAITDGYWNAEIEQQPSENANISVEEEPQTCCGCNNGGCPNQ